MNGIGLHSEETQSILVKTLARFSARFLAGIEEPFTIHATASWEAPASTQHNTTHSWTTRYRIAPKPHPLLLWKGAAMVIHFGIQRWAPLSRGLSSHVNEKFQNLSGWSYYSWRLHSCTAWRQWQLHSTLSPPPGGPCTLILLVSWN